MIDQGEFFQIPSPCQSICEMNSKGYCIGCFRNRNERLHWNQFSEFQKQLVVNLCNKRKLKVIQAKQLSKAQPTTLEVDIPEPQIDLFYEVKMNTSIDADKKPKDTSTPDSGSDSDSDSAKKPKPRDEEQLDLF